MSWLLKSYRLGLIITLLVGHFVISSHTAVAQSSTFTSNTPGGDWSNTVSWTEGGALGDVDHIPDGDDIVIIRGGDQINVTGAEAAGTLTFDASSTSAAMLDISGSLTVSGATTVQSSTAGVNNIATIQGTGAFNGATLQVGEDGVFTVGTTTTTLNLDVASFSVSSTMRVSSFISGVTQILNSTINLTSGDIDVNGLLTVATENPVNTSLLTNASGAQSSTLNLGTGVTAITTAGTGTNTITFDGAASTVNYDRAGNQTVRATSYHNLGLLTSGTKDLGSAGIDVSGNLIVDGANSSLSTNLTIDGNLIINTGSFTVGAADLTVLGTTTVGTGTSGTIAFNNTTGTKIFTGLVTIANGATWNNSANEAVTFQGGVSKVGTFTAGSGTQTFNTNPQTLTGNIILANIDISGINLSNNGNLTLTTISSSGGTITQMNGSTLIFLGSPPSTLTLDASVNTNTVNYNGANQDVISSINGGYYNLVINQSSGEALLIADVTVANLLTLTSGNLDLGGYNLIFTSTADFAPASYSATKMVIASGGSQVRKVFSGSAFTYHVGDNTGAREYSPVTLTPLTGGFTGTVGITVVDAKHPNNASATDYITRYWDVTTTANGSFDFAGTFLTADMSPSTVSNTVIVAKLSGSFNQLSNGWVTSGSAVAGPGVTFSNAALTTTATSSFSGIAPNGPQVNIVFGANPICPGASTSATANVTAGDDSPYVYSWSGAGLSATNIANPTATPAASTLYGITVYDANGRTATSTNTLNLSAATPVPTIGSSGSTVCDGVNPEVTLTSSVAPNGGTYAWFKNGVATGTTTQSIGISDPAGSGSYTVVVTDGTTLCASQPSAAEVVTIYSLPINATVSAVGATAICQSGVVTVRIAASEPGVNYVVRNSSNTPVSDVFAGTGSNLDIVTDPFTGNETLNVLATNAITLCTRVLTNTVSVTVTSTPATPSISTGDPLTQCQGSVSLSLSSSGSGTSHQWYKDGVPVGASSTSYNVPDAVSSSGNYTVTTTTAGPGCVSALSAPVAVVINPSPADLGVSAQTAVAICENQTITIRIAAAEPGVNYQIFDQSNVARSPITPGPGAMADLDIISLSLPTTVTSLYVVAAYGTTGCMRTLTQQVNGITVTPLPVGTTSVQTALCSDVATGYALTVPGATSYAVTVSSNGLTQSAGAGTPNVISDDSWTNVTTASVNVVYTVIPSSGTCAGNAYTVTFPVKPEPKGVSASVSICSGDAVNYDLQNNINTLGNGLLTDFSWTAGSNTNITGEGADVTSTITDILINTTGSDEIVTYTVTPTGNVSGCAGNPFTVTVTVKPTPAVNDIALTRCSDTSLGVAATLNTVGGSVAASSFIVNSITANGLTSSAGIPATGSIVSDALTDDAWTNTTGSMVQVIYNITPVSAAGCSGLPFTVTVNVQTETAIVSDVLTSAVCSDANVSYTLAVTGASTYNISTNSNGLLQSAGTVSAGTLKGATELQGDQWTNTGTSTVNVVYTVTPVTSNSCVGTSFTVTVPINPEPVGVPLAITTCSDVALGSAGNLATASSSVGAGSFVINGIANGGLTPSAGSPAPGAITATDLADDAWTNTTASPATVTYTITPVSAAGCSGNTFTVTLTINPEPATISNITTANVCSDIATGYNLSVTGATSYTISTNSNGLVQSGGTVSAGTNKASNELADDSWTNISTSSTVNVVYTITPINGSCAGNSFTVTVPIKPEPRGANATTAICSNSSVAYNLQTTNINTLGNSMTSTFSWVATDNSNVSGESLTPQSGNVIGNTLVNTTAVDRIVVYTATPTGSASGCVGDPFTVTVTVRPEPFANPITLTLCSDVTLGNAATLATAVGSVSAANFVINSITTTLTASAGSPATGSVSANNLIDDAWTNTTASSVPVVYNITPVSSAGCSGASFLVTINVSPEPVTMSPVTTADVCSDVATGYNLSVTGATTFTISTNSNGLIQSAGTVSAGSGKLANELADDRWTNTSTSSTINVVYTITPFNGTCAGNVFTVTVPIRPEPRGANASTTICSNTAVGYNLQTANINVLGNSMPAGFVWVAADNTNVSGESLTNQSGATITNTLINVTAIDQVVVYTVTPTGTASGCTGDAFTISVTVKPEPVSNAITMGICSDVALGTGATLSTIATSVSAASYTINSITTTLSASAGSPATGSVSANNLIDDAWTNTTAGVVPVIYNITPVSSAGCNGIPFTVTINVSPEPATMSNATLTDVCSDIAVAYNLSVTGATSFTISTNSNGLLQSAGTVSAGSSKTATELADDRWTNITTSTVNVVYTITPFNGTCAGNSFTVTVPIRPEPRGVNSTVTICSNNVVNYNLQTTNVDALGNAMASSFVWVAASNSNVGGESLTNQVGALINNTLTNVTAVDQVVVYTVTPTGNVSGCLGDPFTISVTVRPEPVVSSALDRVVCSDDINGITLNTNGTSVAAASYTINTITIASGLVAAGGNATTGSGKAPNSILNDRFTNTTNGNLTVQYDVTPISSAGCTGASKVITLTVRPEPVLSNTLDRSVCSDVAGALSLATNGTSVTANDYTINSINLASGLTPALGNVTTGSGKNANAISADIFTNETSNSLAVIYNVTPVSALSCAGNSLNITVTIRPEPAGANSLENPVCSDVPFSYNPQSNINAKNSLVSNFTWSAAYATGLTAGVGSGSGAVAETLNNVTDANKNAVYSVTPTSQAFGCVGNIFTITVPIRPEPVGVAAGSTVCSDVAANYNLINNIAINGNNVGSTYSWVAADNVNTTGESLTPQSGGVITNILNNVTNAPHGVLYTVTPTSVAGCVGNAFAITITVNPEPVGIVSNSVICSDLVVGYDLQNNVNTLGNNLPAVFNWSAGSNSNVNGESTLVKTASLIDDILSNPTNNAENVLYTVNPSAQSTGCVGNTFTINVTVNPRAKISAGPDLALCENLPGIALQGSVNYAPNGVTWTGGQGTYSAVGDPNAVYSFKNPQEISTSFTLTLTATDPDGIGPCPQETDQMVLRIDPLPVVVFTGLPSGSPPQMAENNLPITLVGNQRGGAFTISPITSNIGSTFINPVDKAVFDPDAVDLGSNFITYTFTDNNGCTNSNTQEVIVNPITNVDFAVERATLNAGGQYETCAELGLVKLIGFPAASSGFGPETQFTSVPAYNGGPVATIFFDGTDYFIQTTGLVSDTYRIRYDYKNAFGAITFKIRDVRIFASPISNFASSNNCIAQDVVFSDLSTINPTPFPTVIDTWQWNFADLTGSNQANPSKRYTAPGTYDVQLTVRTAQGCYNTTAAGAHKLRVGAVPVPQFKWGAICNFEFTKFEDLSTNPGNVSTITDYSWDFGDGNILTGPNATSIPAGTHGGTTKGVYEGPEHEYANFDTYPVKLTVTTNDGCSASITKDVFILPYSTVTPSTTAGYHEDFELTDGGWIAEAFEATNSTAINPILSDTSWVWGIPQGAHVNASNSSKSWWTGLCGDTTYFRNENSFVNGPCFNLTNLDRPMLSLDYFADTDLSDGAVLEYSIDGGANWEIVGPDPLDPIRDQGINWYNGRNILSNPGGQLRGQYGWTGQITEGQGRWKNARFNLDMVPPAKRQQVRLRIAFSSNDGNPSGDYDGFAFDNVFVGNKRRTVLVEHFTNGTTSTAVTYLDKLFKDQKNYHAEPDFVKMQYHMGVPAADPINFSNPSDPGARAFLYDIVAPPYTVMDGIIGDFYGKILNGDHAVINAIELDRRALEDPAFLVDPVVYTPTTATNVLQAHADFTFVDSVNALSTPVIFQLALVETGVNGHRNVLRKLLLQSEGLTVNRTWRPGDQQTINVDYTVDVPIVNPDSLFLIGFVQDKATKRILQSRLFKAPRLDGITPVGVEDDPSTAEIANISVFPNPASKKVNFYLENPLAGTYGWHIVDQRGVAVKQGELNNDLSNPQHVEIHDLASGIYFVRFTKGDRTVVYRKIAILNAR